MSESGFHSGSNPVVGRTVIGGCHAKATAFPDLSGNFLFVPQFASMGWTQADPFYKGKTIRIMVGSTAGGFYDPLGPPVCEIHGKVYPGQPEIIAQNMPGAGS